MMTEPDKRKLFDQLYAGYSAKLLSSALRRPGVGRPDAEDLVQESFIQVWRGLDKLKQPESPWGWLSKILKQSWWRWCKRQRLQRSVGGAGGIDGLADLAEDRTEALVRAEIEGTDYLLSVAESFGGAQSKFLRAGILHDWNKDAIRAELQRQHDRYVDSARQAVEKRIRRERQEDYRALLAVLTGTDDGDGKPGRTSHRAAIEATRSNLRCPFVRDHLTWVLDYLQGDRRAIQRPDSYMLPADEDEYQEWQPYRDSHSTTFDATYHIHDISGEILVGVLDSALTWQSRKIRGFNPPPREPAVMIAISDPFTSSELGAVLCEQPPSLGAPWLDSPLSEWHHWDPSGAGSGLFGFGERDVAPFMVQDSVWDETIAVQNGVHLPIRKVELLEYRCACDRGDFSPKSSNEPSEE